VCINCMTVRADETAGRETKLSAMPKEKTLTRMTHTSHQTSIRGAHSGRKDVGSNPGNEYSCHLTFQPTMGRKLIQKGFLSSDDCRVALLRAEIGKVHPVHDCEQVRHGRRFRKWGWRRIDHTLLIWCLALLRTNLRGKRDRLTVGCRTSTQKEGDPPTERKRKAWKGPFTCN